MLKIVKISNKTIIRFRYGNAPELNKQQCVKLHIQAYQYAIWLATSVQCNLPNSKMIRHFLSLR